MEYLPTTILFLCISCIVYSQQIEDCPTCPCIIELGDKYTKKKEYEDAIDMYNAATACDINLKEEADRKIKVVFKKIEKERDDAVAAEKRALKAEGKAKQSLIAEEEAKEKSKEALKQAQTAEQKATTEGDRAKRALIAEEKAKEEVKEALKQAKVSEQKAIKQKKIAEEQTRIAKDKTESLQAILDALYFYGDSLALAYNIDKYGFANYGFINKKGDVLIDYKYNEVLPFDNKGYAKVRKGKTDYMIDTKGREYRWTDDVNKLNKNIEVFYFYGQIGTETDSVRRKILNNKQFKVLFLEGCNIRHLLPAEIGQLTNLQTLSLSGNKLTSLPAEIGQLTNLQHLSLGGNKLTSLPAGIEHLMNLQYLYLVRNE